MQFLNKIENKIRLKLSRYPILYALIGGIGVVLFWRGVWHIADDMSMSSSLSFIVGFIILILTGIFVSEFIGKKLIITGLVGEKKMEEKEEREIAAEEKEIETEAMQLSNLQNTLSRLEKKLDHMEDHLEENEKGK